MKKIILFFGILLACYGAFAQTLNVQGTVQDNGVGIANNPVILHIYSGGAYIGQDSSFTDSAGFYIFAYPLSPSINFGVAIVETPDCQSGWLADSASFSSGNMNLVINFAYCSSGGNCQSGFMVNTTATGALLFTDQSYSSAGITSWLWDFGDGNTSTQQNPTHTYNTAGTFNVCLTITDGAGCSNVQCQVVTFGGSSGCTALFSSFDMGGGQFFFDADTSSNSPNHIYSWDFGDGTPSGNGPTVSHTYAANSVYMVCLTVVDSNSACFTTFCDSVVVGNPGGNLCQASYAYFPSQNSQVQFLNLSTGSTPVTSLNYSWDFGDGSYSTQENPSHTFPADSSYWVCLAIWDATGCSDTICYSVIVQDTTAGCDAAFTSFDTGNLIVAFSSLSPSPNLSYDWDLGDGSTSTQTSPVHTYGAAGSYWVCLTVADSTIGCDTTFCDSIYVSGTGAGCNANFTFISQGSNTFDFIDISGNSTGVTTWFWDFGDSTSSTQQNPTHAFSNSGPHYVCLTISDSSGCTDSYCDFVIDSTLSSGYMVSGGVYADSQLVYNAIVYLIEHDTVAGTLTAVDSVYLTQSYYTFFNVSPGSYLVKAALLPPSPVYASYLPTYLGDELFWNNATSTVVTNNNIFNPSINMIAGTNLGGPGFIGGLISQGANKNEGDPMVNVSVILLDMNDQPITHTVTDENGEYSFDNLAYGTYKIMVEILGKYGNPIIVTISAENPSEENADFDVNISSVNPTTAIDDFTFGELLSVYPNPAVDQVNIEMELYQPVEMEVRLVNLMGQAIQRKSLGRVGGNQLIQLETGQVPQGIYLIQIQAGDQQIVKRIVVGL